MIGAVLGRGRRRTGWCLGGATGLVAASVLSVIVTAGVASAAPRDLDPSFGNAGIVQYSVGAPNSPTGAAATGVAVIPPTLPAAGGDIVVSTDGGSSGMFEVARFTPSGAIDTSFGGHGTGLLDPVAGQANAVAVVPAGVTGAGDIVAVGEQSTSSLTCANQQPVVMVYTPTGTTTTTPIPCPTGGFFNGVLNAVTIDTSGNIAVAGQVFSPTATLETLVAELNPTGGVTLSRATQIGTSNSAAMGVGVSPSGGDIYTTGYSYKLVGTVPTDYLTVAAFTTSSGALDSNFNSTGVLQPAQNGIGDAIAVMPHGNVVIAGQVANQSFLAQYTSGGVAVTTFIPPSLGPISEAKAVAYQPEGGVLVVGGTFGSGSSRQMVVAQVDSANGMSNPLFNNGGVLIVPFSAGPSSLAAIAVQLDGKAVGAGDAPTVNAAPEIGMVRVQVPAPRPYTPISPTRVCDTRGGLTGFAGQCNGHTIAANASLTVQIAGHGFGVPADATAVVANVTAINPAGAGFLTVYPAGSPLPNVSNLNVTTGQAVANLTEVTLGNGNIAVKSSVRTDVTVDIEGYTSPEGYTAAIPGGGPGAGLYDPLPSPTRICDTRGGLAGFAGQCNGKTLQPNIPLAVQVAGQFGVPANATAVVANLTAVNPAVAGFLEAYPDGISRPNTSNVSFSAGQVIPDRVIVRLIDGKVDLISSTRTDAIFDISGFFTAAGGTGTGYVAEPAPVRICDTRLNQGLTGDATQCTGHTLGPGGTLNVRIADPNFSVPSTATAAVTNVTAVNPTGSTFLTVYPTGTLRPSSSDLNPPRGGVEPNLVVDTLSSAGHINIFNNLGQVDLIVDLAGYYTAPGAGS